MLRRFNIRLAATVNPTFEIFRVMDKPEDGHLTRVVFVDRKSVIISKFPQLGPRKEDPSDNVPQFDANRRSTVRFRMHEAASFLAVLEGKIQSREIKTDRFTVNAKRTDSGFEIAASLISGPADQRVTQNVDFSFDNMRTTQLYHFLDAAVKESIAK